jgi:hypothetical protein
MDSLFFYWIEHSNSCFDSGALFSQCRQALENQIMSEKIERGTVGLYAFANL